MTTTYYMYFIIRCLKKRNNDIPIIISALFTCRFDTVSKNIMAALSLKIKCLKSLILIIIRHCHQRCMMGIIAILR